MILTSKNNPIIKETVALKDKKGRKESFKSFFASLILQIIMMEIIWKKLKKQKCVSCGRQFTLTDSEIDFYNNKNFDL